MRVDVFVVGQEEGFVVAPSGAPLPGDEMAVLGDVRFGWSIDSETVAPRLDWQGIAKDIDARGYSIVPQGEVGGLSRARLALRDAGRVQCRQFIAAHRTCPSSPQNPRPRPAPPTCVPSVGPTTTSGRASAPSAGAGTR